MEIPWHVWAALAYLYLMAGAFHACLYIVSMATTRPKHFIVPAIAIVFLWAPLWIISPFMRRAKRGS